MSELIENKFILGDNIWLLLGDGNLPIRSQEPQAKMPFLENNLKNLKLSSTVPLIMEFIFYGKTKHKVFKLC